MAPAQHVRIRLLGRFDVQVDGVAVPAGGWRLTKARSLLKLLALAEGNRLHRDAIVGALWPELGADARNGQRVGRCSSAAGWRRLALP